MPKFKRQPKNVVKQKREEVETPAEDMSVLDMLDVPPQEKVQMAADAERYAVKGIKLIHSDETSQQVVQALSDTENPLESVANATVSVLQRIDSAARQGGQEPHDLVKMEAGFDLMREVVELGEASGSIQPMSPEDVQASYAIAVEKYLNTEIENGRIDKDALAASMKNGLQKLGPAEQKAIDNQVRGIGRHAVASTGQEVQGVRQESGQAGGGLL